MNEAQRVLIKVTFFYARFLVLSLEQHFSSGTVKKFY